MNQRHSPFWKGQTQSITKLKIVRFVSMLPAKDVQTQVQNSQSGKENPAGTNCPTKLLMPVLFIVCQNKEAAENIKGEGRGAAEIAQHTADCPGKTEGQHTDRGHQQKFQPVGAIAV